MNSTPRILFVDDDKDTRDLFVIALTYENYQVVTASTAAQALDQAKSQPFDLVVLDSRLGDGSGIEVCRAIRETDQTTPILFCSGRAYDHDKVEALSAGAQRYLVKPVDIPDLCHAMKDLIVRYPKNGKASDGDGRGNGKPSRTNRLPNPQPA